MTEHREEDMTEVETAGRWLLQTVTTNSNQGTQKILMWTWVPSDGHSHPDFKRWIA